MKGKEPDCKACLGTIQPENQLPLAIFWRVKGQVIIGPGLPLDLKLDVVREEIARNISDPGDQDYCLDLIFSGFAAYMEIIRDKQKERMNK